MAEEKIYTVEFNSYDGGGIHGIYRTREEARERLRRIEKEYRGLYRFKSPDMLIAVNMDGEPTMCGDYLIYERKFGDVDR